MEYMGSNYKGDKKYGRLEGEGEYVLPTKTRYEGHLKDGMFHGPGTLHFPNGNKFTGEWENGFVINGQYIYSDGLATYGADQSKWQYCSERNDRRFYSEVCQGLKPAGRSQITDQRNDWELPTGFFDTGDGIYDRLDRVVYDYGMNFRRNADYNEHSWILYTCRKGWDEYSEETKEKKKIIEQVIKYEDK